MTQQCEPGAANWWEHPERGSAFALALIVWIVRRLGRGAGYLALYPICLYYVLFSPTSVRASRQFLSKVLHRRPARRDIFRHHYVFAATLLDRVHLLTGQYERFSISVHGYEHLGQYTEAGRGCIVLGAHLGSFDAMRALALSRDIPIKALMFQHNARGFQRLDAKLNAELAKHIIEIGQPDTLLKAREALEAGICLGLLGDRTLGGEQRSESHEFLGEPARFPAGPYRLAKLLNAPIVLFFGLYTGPGRYDIYFERLIADRQGVMGRREAERAWIAAYASRLEHYARLAPFNWFNFYDFWNAAKH
jgi:predicted LPLAT superfamily acyltransferase